MTDDEMIEQAERDALALQERTRSRRESDSRDDNFTTRSTPRISAGAAARDHASLILENYLDARLGTPITARRRAELRDSGYLAMPFARFAKAYAEACDDRMSGSEVEIAGRILQNRAGVGQGAMATADLSSALIDAVNRRMLLAYSEAPETWPQWAATVPTSGFLPTSIATPSAAKTPGLRAENEEYPSTSIYSAVKETGRLATYGAEFVISRPAIVNDDLETIGAIVAAHGRACARVVGDLAVGVLTANAALGQDGIALFDSATHRNYVTAGASPSVTTLDAGCLAMAAQTSNGVKLGVQPRYLLVPTGLRSTAKILADAMNSPQWTSATDILPVIEHRLDTFNPAGWFLMGDPTLSPVVAVLSLDGELAPFLERKTGTTFDGVAYKVRIDASALAVDYRGAYYNDGA